MALCAPYVCVPSKGQGGRAWKLPGASPTISQPVWSSGPQDSEAQKLCELFDQQLALVKTVKNADWLELVRNLRGGSFRTSVSLPPTQGLAMRLFGEVRSGCAGLIWNRLAVDLSGAFIWPSGYMAKTEFNLTSAGELLNGRAQAVVSLEHLIACNKSMSYTDPSTGERHQVTGGGMLPFNEINFWCQGTAGISAVFVRSTEARHLLHALGVVSLLEHTLGLKLPLLVLDAFSPVRPVEHGTKLELLREVMRSSFETMVHIPRLPLNLKPYAELADTDKLLFHSKYGATAASLNSLFKAKLQTSPAQFLTSVSVALRAAVDAKNAYSAREIVRASAPLLLGFTRGLHGIEKHQDEAAGLKKLLGEILDACEAVDSSQEHLLVVLGTQIILQEFASGGIESRLEQACEEVEEWLENATSESITKGFFLVKSWLHTWQQDSNSQLTSFLSGDAVANRSNFLEDLEKLSDAKNAEGFFRQLYDLVNSLHSPNMRFRQLRRVLGLDERFDRKVVHGIVCFAYDILLPEAGSAFGVDEATRLEAEEVGSTATTEVLGVATPQKFSSDPLGMQQRKCRVRYRADRSRKT
mmetsp:Transcript_13538/g.23867  ORF Transcript_13538/g.23867 Transcript_13538/m.23867 type:complete len:583 (-) Transcript_13538:223-1971(-)